MKKLIGIAVAGALALGYQASALAQATPDSDNADIWLFVADPATQTTFAEDTGIAISSIMPTYNGSTVDPAYVTNANLLSGVFTANINKGPSTALSNFISSNGASNLEWAIEAVQYNTSSFTAAKKPGSVIGLTDNNANPAQIGGMQLSGNLEPWGSSFDPDVLYLDNTLATGGSTYAWSAGGSAGQVWGGPPGASSAGSTTEYGQGPDQSGVGLGTQATMYGVTGNLTTGQVQSYILGQLELTATGTLETISNVTQTPLPGALLLFGSGLVGLIGIGRRRSAASSATAA